jgi:hypothetical protein
LPQVRDERPGAIPFVRERAPTAIVESRRAVAHSIDRLVVAITRHPGSSKSVPLLEVVNARLEEVGVELHRLPE